MISVWEPIFTISVSVCLAIVVWLQYKLKDYKCDYITNDKLCYAVSNGFYEWCIIVIAHGTMQIDTKQQCACEK